MGKKIIVIGAGPAGLTGAYELTKKGLSVTVLECNKKNVGGIAQTANYKGYRFDIGGHRFFSKSDKINELWDEMMLPQKFLKVNRFSRIYYNQKFFNYPIKAVNALFGLGIIKSTKVLLSYLKIKMSPEKEEKNFEQWVTNRFGKELFNTFFKTYTEKVWGTPCTEISADWAAQRIKGLSLTKAVISALFPQKKGKIKTLIDEFKYPKFGPGMLWENVANKIKEKGNEVIVDRKVIELHRSDNELKSVIAIDSEGRTKEYSGTEFISTMPLKDLINSLHPKAPDEIINAANSLKYRDFLTVALIIDEKELFPDNWIYIHDPSVKLGRIQNFKNWSKHLIADENMNCLGLEYFCFEGDDFWTMKDDDLIELAKKEISSINLVKYEKIKDGTVIRMPKAYPVYDEGYENNVLIIRKFIEEKLKNLHLVGRNGMHKYNNQDHSMMTALLAAKNILGENHDVWKVNSDAEYHEEEEEK